MPYLAMRAMSAALGALTVPLVFLIMRESRCSVPASIATAALVLLDNAQVTQSRFILLDGPLLFFVTLSLFSYIRFHKQRSRPFSGVWWAWLFATGASLSCAISVKYVGAFSFLAVGSAVAIDLWDLLRLPRRHGYIKLSTFGAHVVARLLCLVVVPFLLYLGCFYVHFAMLPYSGSGDSLMSPQFQQTLAGNPTSMEAVTVYYHDVITVRNKETEAFLHSSLDLYPARYDDGRVSSQGPVVGTVFDDTSEGALWEILPTISLEGNADDDHQVITGDTVRLRHVETGRILLSHGIASPMHETRAEFTTVAQQLADGARYNDTCFELQLERPTERGRLETRASHFRLIHVPTLLAMSSDGSELPGWGQGQQEVSGNRQLLQASNIWLAGDLPLVPGDSPRRVKEATAVKSLSFWTKYRELQKIMFARNKAIVTNPPYGSRPHHWPLLLHGFNYWIKRESRQQIFLLGNPVGWWVAAVAIVFFLLTVAGDQFLLRRSRDVLKRGKWESLAIQ